MERNVKHLLLTRTTFSKPQFSREENLKKCTNFQEQKGTRYNRGNVYIDTILFSCLLSTKPCLRFLFKCFVQVGKGFCQCSFGNEVDFNVSLDILAKN